MLPRATEILFRFCSRAFDVLMTQVRHSSLSGAPSFRTRLPSNAAFRGNPLQAASMTAALDTLHPRHLVPFRGVSEDQRLMDATSPIALPAAPETSRSLPVRRTILPDPPCAHTASTMHLMHSSEPGTGVRRHLLQSMMTESPERDTSGPLSLPLPMNPRSMYMGPVSPRGKIKAGPCRHVSGCGPLDRQCL